jgi:threonine/homoserine/homoserine lactone efflux protein
MFDARFIAFTGLAALLVVSPGPTIAVITETALERGRAAALWTVFGVAVANSTLSLSAAFGLSAVFQRWPWTLEAVTVGGAAYLAFLGLRGLWRAAAAPGRRASTKAGNTVRPAPGGLGGPGYPGGRLGSIGKGVATNLLNPSVALFYATVVPQFIRPEQPVLARFLLLCGTHVVLAAGWHVIYAYSLGTLAERLTRPGIRRAMEVATGLVLLGFGLRLLAGSGR